MLHTFSLNTSSQTREIFVREKTNKFTSLPSHHIAYRVSKICIIEFICWIRNMISRCRKVCIWWNLKNIENIMFKKARSPETFTECKTKETQGIFRRTFLSVGNTLFLSFSLLSSHTLATVEDPYFSVFLPSWYYIMYQYIRLVPTYSHQLSGFSTNWDFPRLSTNTYSSRFYENTLPNKKLNFSLMSLLTFVKTSINTSSCV